MLRRSTAAPGIAWNSFPGASKTASYPLTERLKLGSVAGCAQRLSKLRWLSNLGSPMACATGQTKAQQNVLWKVEGVRTVGKEEQTLTRPAFDCW